MRHLLLAAPASRRTTPTGVAAREAGPPRGARGLHGDDRRRTRHHGSRQPRGPGRGCHLRRLQHRAAHEQASPPSSTSSLAFDHFFVRQVLLLKYSVLAVGGAARRGRHAGRALRGRDLIETGKVKDFPILLYGNAEAVGPWLLEQLDRMVAAGTVRGEGALLRARVRQHRGGHGRAPAAAGTALASRRKDGALCPLGGSWIEPIKGRTFRDAVKSMLAR